MVSHSLYRIFMGLVMHRHIFTKRTVRRAWFLSYLLVFLVPLVLCLIIYQISCQTVREESERIYNSQLSQIHNVFDSQITEIQKIQSQLLASNTIQAVTRIREKATPEQQIQLVDAMNELKSMALTFDDIADVYVVLGPPRAVISQKGYMSFDLFYDLFYASSGRTESQLWDYLTQRHGINDVTICDNGGQKLLLFPLTTIDNSFGRDDGTIVVAYSQDVPNQILSSFQWDPRIGLGILNPSGQILASTGNGNTFPLPYSALRSSDHFLYTSINGEKTGVLTRPSSVSDWRYVLLAPVSMMNESSRRIRIYSLLGLAICMAVGFLLSARLTEQQYHPLARLMQQLRRKDAAASAQQSLPRKAANEYDQLDQYLQDFFQKSGSTEHALRSSQQALHQYHLYELLERPYDLSVSAVPAKEQNQDLELPGPRYLVALFSCTAPASPGNETAVIREDLLQFAFSNIFQEIVDSRYPIAMTNAGRYAAAIISCAGDAVPDSLSQDIRRTLHEVHQFFHLSSTCAAGGIHEKLSGIHYSYVEALEAADYCTEDEPLIVYDDIRDARGGYTFSLDEVRKLTYFVAAGEEAQAGDLIRQVYESNRRNLKSSSVCRCLAHDIMSALLRGANQAGINGLRMVSFQEIDQIPPEKLEDHLLQMVSSLCQSVQKQKDSTPSSQLREDICTYIQGNYQNPDLNISQVGLHFGLTPAYLSSIFKRETGQNLLGYINHIRIEQARNLLSQDLSVAAIAEQTGFRDSGALIRVFKKETGLTPGQYRDTLSSGSSRPGSSAQV